MDYSNIRERYKDGDGQWTQKQEQILLEPYTYISANPGKEIRSLLINAFNVWLKVPEPELEIVRNIVRMLHNASLLMDDVEDNSELRRGEPVAHTVYGVPQTINTANYVYFLAMQDLVALKTSASRAASGTSTPASGGESSRSSEKRRAKAEHMDLFGLVTDELLNLHRGQGLDLFWRDSLTCPTEEEYVQMVLGKTGGLFRIAVKLMMAMSDRDTDFVPLVNLISIYFQIRDDYMNLQSAEYKDNKGFCEDLTEGKFSFPVVHGIRADPSNHQILNVLQKRTSSHALKQHIVDYLRNQTKSFEYTRNVLVTLKAQLDDELAALGGNPALEAIMRKLDIPNEEPAATM